MAFRNSCFSQYIVLFSTIIEPFKGDEYLIKKLQLDSRTAQLILFYSFRTIKFSVERKCGQYSRNIDSISVITIEISM